MIANITLGSAPAGALQYASEKDGAELLETNMAGTDWKSWAMEMDAVSGSNSRCKQPVFHASLSAPDGEHPTRDQWKIAAAAYLREMGFDDAHQFAVIRHCDAEHDHIHVIANRVSPETGRAVDMKHDFRRSHEAARTAEREAGMQRLEHHKPQAKGRLVELRAEIDKAAEGAPSLECFKARLSKRGIDVIEHRQSTGRISGVSFQDSKDGKTWKGSEIGRGYSVGGLQKKGLQLETKKHELLARQKERIKPSARSNRIMKKMGAPSFPTPQRLLSRAIRAALQL